MDDLEMCVYAWVAGRVTHSQSPAQTLRVSDRVAHGLKSWGKRSGGEAPGALCERAERLAWRWVHRVMGARGDCYDRAVAARWWLARRGVHVKVIIGVRKGGNKRVEGHAWIEDEQGACYLVGEGAGYTEVSRG